MRGIDNGDHPEPGYSLLLPASNSMKGTMHQYVRHTIFDIRLAAEPAAGAEDDTKWRLGT